MEYTIIKLSQLTGLSPRSIRYLDEIKILKPKIINDLGHRIYTQSEVDLLQVILLYRKLGLSLEEIKSIVSEPDFSLNKALIESRKKLVEMKNQIDTLINTIDKTVTSNENLSILTNREKFFGINHNQKI